MAQVFDTEIAKKLEPIAELAREDVFKKMLAGLDSTIEVATETGSDSLKRTAEAAKEGAVSVVAVFDSLFECVDKYAEYNKRMEEALG